MREGSLTGDKRHGRVLNGLAMGLSSDEISQPMTERVWPWVSLRWLTATLAMLLTLGALARRVQAQPSARCDESQRVRAVEFDGSPLFDDAALAAAIATPTPTVAARMFSLSPLPCSDSTTLALDALRIAVLHRQAGWPQAHVAVSAKRSLHGARIVFSITPGPVALLDTLRIDGLPPAPPGDARYDTRLLALLGERFDRVRLDTVVTAVVSRLRDDGYARAARPALTMRIDSVTSRVRLDLTFVPGPLMTLRAVTVDVQGIGDLRPTIDSATVRKLTNLQPGTRFRASDIVKAQRELYRTDVFRLVLIDTVTPPVAEAAGDTLLDLRIAVAEARTKSARVGAGWATLECIRVQGRLTDRRFLGVGRRLELTARASRIGVGPPADFAPQLCSSALKADSLFTVLNHYLGATFSSAHLYTWSLYPVATLYTERRSEPYAYVRTTRIGGLFELTRPHTTQLTSTYGLQYEDGSTKVDPAEACTRFGQCSPEEYAQSLVARGLGVVNTTLTFDRSNNVFDPSRGYRVRGEARAGVTTTEIDSSVVFFRLSGEGAVFRRVLRGVVATRLQVSRAFAPGAQFVDGTPLIPQQERLYAGGQNSVRGYQQNLLGPLLYVVSRIDTTTNGGVPVVESVDGATYDRAVPRGGTALLVANIEFRRGFRVFSEQLQVAGFVDMGSVWDGGPGSFRFGDVRATPGVGLRILTPLGPFRVDVGYLPYQPPAGRALYVNRGTLGSPGTILCASPGNTVSIDPENPGSIFDCPATFRPPGGHGVLGRLAFHFGLGQAF